MIIIIIIIIAIIQLSIAPFVELQRRWENSQLRGI